MRMLLLLLLRLERVDCQPIATGSVGSGSRDELGEGCLLLLPVGGGNYD